MDYDTEQLMFFKNSVMSFFRYNDTLSAELGVETGSIWGFININRNFSDAYVARSDYFVD